MKWSLHDLAPVCPVPHCPKYGTRHLLPHQENIATQILTGDETYIYWQGGVGSAKTLLWGVLAAAYMIMIPGCRIILFRKDYGLLHETLWKYFTDAIAAATEQRIIQANFAKLWSVKKPTGYTLCTLPNGSVARAGQTKNWSEFMGPTYDAIFVSDAMENNNFGEIFRGEGVVGGLHSRLRGQKAGFFKVVDGSLRDMRRFLIESNPPPNINELHVLFGREPGVRQFTLEPDPLTGKHITYRHIQASTDQNDHNPGSYVREISAMHSDPGDIRRILRGETVPYYGGVRVIRTFQPEVHVSSFDLLPDLPLFVAIDPGSQHPAVIVAQIRRCDFQQEHCIALSEITNLYDLSTRDLVERHEGPMLGILAHLGLQYPTYFDYDAYRASRQVIIDLEGEDEGDFTSLADYFLNIQFCIDQVGRNRARQSKDRLSDRIVLWRYYGINTIYRTNLGLEKSLDRVNDTFSQICICGLPVQMVDQQCEMLIDGYSGGYRYPKKRDGSHGDKPIEDHQYEDPADAHRYLLENFFFQSNFVLVPPSLNQQYAIDQPQQWLAEQSF